MSETQYDQASDHAFNPYDFDGEWLLVKDESTIRDEDTGEFIEETLTNQWLERSTVGDVMTCKMHVQSKPDLTIHMEFTVKLGGDEWVPYTVVAIDGDPNDPQLAPGDDKMLKAGTRIGEPIAWLKVIYVDPRTQVRITKNVDGSSQYVLLSRLSEDGNKLYGYVMTPDGHFVIDKHFERKNAEIQD